MGGRIRGSPTSPPHTSVSPQCLSSQRRAWPCQAGALPQNRPAHTACARRLLAWAGAQPGTAGASEGPGGCTQACPDPAACRAASPAPCLCPGMPLCWQPLWLALPVGLQHPLSRNWSSSAVPAAGVEDFELLATGRGWKRQAGALLLPFFLFPSLAGGKRQPEPGPGLTLRLGTPPDKAGRHKAALLLGAVRGWGQEEPGRCRQGWAGFGCSLQD